jgi:hypothetical protein
MTAPAANLGALDVPHRVHLLIEDVRTHYGVHLRINQSHRTREQAQEFHICHMFLHNFFNHLRPKHVGADGRTIDWKHLSDSKVQWSEIKDPTQFLRTKAGHPVKKGSQGWLPGHEPDKTSSVNAMAHFLKKHHVSSMAAPGINGCGEPCGCGGKSSKHLTVPPQAVDLDGHGLVQLSLAVLKVHKGVHLTPEVALDHFLKNYQLYRPLAHLPGKAREVWHVEALPGTPVSMHRHPQHHHVGC